MLISNKLIHVVQINILQNKQLNQKEHHVYENDSFSDDPRNEIEHFNITVGRCCDMYSIKLCT